jgi:hypothetical protein
MRSALYPVLAVVVLLAVVERSRADLPSFLYQPAFAIDDHLRPPAEPYLPQPGDIMLRLDPNMFWRVTHYMALAFDPNGSAIVVRRADGRLAILEAGPNDTMGINNMDMLPHLKGYHDVGQVWIRRRKVPLTPEQDRCLTEFAEKCEGKWFALQRLGWLLTPFRNRGPLRTRFMGKSNPDRISYYCAELVCEACIAAGLLDAERTRPSATFPRDLFYGRSFNPFIDKHLDINCGWHPPARWTYCPVKP